MQISNAISAPASLRTVIRAFSDPRHRQHKPVSTATTESAVNPMISQRMCKRQQMCWSLRAIHLLVQLRYELMDGHLVERLVRYME